MCVSSGSVVMGLDDWMKVGRYRSVCCSYVQICKAASHSPRDLDWRDIRELSNTACRVCRAVDMGLEVDAMAKEDNDYKKFLISIQIFLNRRRRRKRTTIEKLGKR